MKIYLENGEFKLSPYNVIYLEETIDIIDKEEFERFMVTDRNETTNFEYKENTLTPEQLYRLSEVQGSRGYLEEVNNYVLYGVFPKGNHSLKFLEIEKLLLEKDDDDEKMAVAEAIIDLDQRLNNLEGGNK